MKHLVFFLANLISISKSPSAIDSQSPKKYNFNSNDEQIYCNSFNYNFLHFSNSQYNNSFTLAIAHPTDSAIIVSKFEIEYRLIGPYQNYYQDMMALTTDIQNGLCNGTMKKDYWPAQYEFVHWNKFIYEERRSMSGRFHKFPCGMSVLSAKKEEYNSDFVNCVSNNYNLKFLKHKENAYAEFRKTTLKVRMVEIGQAIILVIAIFSGKKALLILKNNCLQFFRHSPPPQLLAPSQVVLENRSARPG